MAHSFNQSDFDARRPIHIIPINDIFEHTESIDCTCKPVAIPETRLAFAKVIHNSFDGRELIEKYGLM